MQKKILAPDLELVVTQLSSTFQKEAHLLKSKQLVGSFFPFMRTIVVLVNISIVFIKSFKQHHLTCISRCLNSNLPLCLTKHVVKEIIVKDS